MTNDKEVIGISPVKTLSRQPFMLMLQDDSGELTPVRLDPALVRSDTAIIVLDEYSDTCWVWVGRDVNMPTRMHALRMGHALQRSGFKVGVTTIGMASSRLVEILEKDASDPEVAANIEAFKSALQGRWKFEDDVLAYDESRVPGEAPVPTTPTVAPSYEAPAPAPSATTPAAAEPVTYEEPAPRPVPQVTPPAEVQGGAMMKTAYLLYSIAMNTDLVYTERFERNGRTGLKVEVPGIMVIEATIDGDNLRITPPHFGDGEEAARIRAEYERLTRGL